MDAQTEKKNQQHKQGKINTKSQATINHTSTVLQYLTVVTVIISLTF